ncbi:VOC family protein [Streptomyces sp. NRRL S-87]|uniref:VOC family protein n=1 Tax=Streptomyces sp. NRRL S-87 TaxID=1463920 RepID=UPI0004C07D4D|nr:VOC family protein [Streptomyces sp. NRRL S-87]
MLGTDFVHGSPNWIDIGSPDTAATAEFYSAVLGWTFVSAGPDAGGYGFFQVDGKTVGAVGPLTEEGARSAWMVYFQSDDAAATTQAVLKGGGTVRAEPMDVMGEGWLAQYTDPHGARFAVWQPGKTKGLGRASDDNSLVWVELMAKDPTAAIAFYKGLFDWRHQDMQTPGMVYRVLSVADGDFEQGSFGGVAPRDAMPTETLPPPRWIPYFMVADVDDVVRRTQGAGGSVVMPATDVPDVGRMAWLSDPHGAHFAVLKPDPRMG